MDAGFASWLFVMSVGASALGGMLGMASGIFIVPILTLFGGVDLRTAISRATPKELPLSQIIGEPWR